MKTAIILHGMPSKEEYYNPDSAAQSNKHWLPWLQRQLILADILAQTPELPQPYAPDYDNWRHVFEQFSVDAETVLVGHSCGAGFLVRWLSENKVTVGKVMLVAPWLDPEREFTRGFFDFTLDPDMARRTDGVTIFNSDNDIVEVQRSVSLLRADISGAQYRQLPGRGHFTLRGMGTTEFPQLREEILGE
jgi:predicted alpha/beta hydrolase family esterase